MARYKRNLSSAQRQRAIRRAQYRKLRMIAGRGVVLVALVVAIGAGSAQVFAHGTSKSAPPRASALSKPRTVKLDCPSPALGGRLPAVAYLPAGYTNTRSRFAVLYFLHGLPATTTSYEANGFVARAVAKIKQPAIVVMPQGARSNGSDREYLDWGSKEDWPQAISHDLVRCIDTHFRTFRSRNGRALVGLSAGGFGAFNIGLRELSVFGAVESWSGYFTATGGNGLPITFASSQANAAAAVPQPAAILAAVKRDPAFIGFYVGDSDTHYLPANQVLEAALQAAGLRHLFAIYPGGHDDALWRVEAPRWVGEALAYLARARQADDDASARGGNAAQLAAAAAATGGGTGAAVLTNTSATVSIPMTAKAYSSGPGTGTATGTTTGTSTTTTTDAASSAAAGAAAAAAGSTAHSGASQAGSAPNGVDTLGLTSTTG